MPSFVVDVSAAQADVLVFDFTSTLGPWRGDQLPIIKSLYYDADAALAVSIYMAAAGGASEASRIPLVNATLQHAARSCYPIWVDPTTFDAWGLRITKPAGAAFLRVSWSRSV